MKQIGLLIILLFGMSHAHAQHTQGNGGDAYVSEFFRIARKMQKVMEMTKAGESYGIHAGDFLKTIEVVAPNTSSTDEILYLNNLPKDVKNFPDTKTIQISRPRWRSVLENQKDQIVVHEILGIMGYPDQMYEISSYIILAANATLESIGLASIQNPKDYSEWATKVDIGLKESLQLSYQASSVKSEFTLLKNSIIAVLDSQTLRNQKFFAHTLNSALQDIELFAADQKVQVRIMRYSIELALDDLAHFSQSILRLNDYSTYVTRIFSKGLAFAELAKTSLEEMLLLEALLRRGMNFVMMNDFNRTATNACIVMAINRSLELATNVELPSTKIEIYKATLRSILKNELDCE